MCPRCGWDVELGAEDLLGPQFTAMQCGRCGESWRWSDAGADAFSLILARCVGTMAPVEDQYSPAGLPRAARIDVDLDLRFRVKTDQEWQHGRTANLSRSGVLFHTCGIGAFPPQQRTDPGCSIEIVIEVPQGVLTSQVHCHATVARTVEPASGERLGTVAATVGDYILMAN